MKSKNTIRALGTFTLVAGLAYCTILEYNIPAASYESIDAAEDKIIYAEHRYEQAYQDALIACTDTLKTDPEYTRLVAEMESVEPNAESPICYDTKYFTLQIKTDSLAKELCEKHILNNPNLNKTRKYLDNAYYYKDSLVRAHNIADSIRQQPIKTRLKGNLQQMYAKIRNSHTK